MFNVTVDANETVFIEPEKYPITIVFSIQSSVGLRSSTSVNFFITGDKEADKWPKSTKGRTVSGKQLEVSSSDNIGLNVGVGGGTVQGRSHFSDDDLFFPPVAAFA